MIDLSESAIQCTYWSISVFVLSHISNSHGRSQSSKVIRNMKFCESCFGFNLFMVILNENQVNIHIVWSMFLSEILSAHIVRLALVIRHTGSIQVVRKLRRLDYKVVFDFGVNFAIVVIPIINGGSLSCFLPWLNVYLQNPALYSFVQTTLKITFIFSTPRTFHTNILKLLM